ncbi:MAG TPA: hypothetical protein VG276_07695 [Actinomycetes bacterium]|jgi:hypothetical protein|nr:hypothetical protein [Actinomycetes bacterium]
MTAVPPDLRALDDPVAGPAARRGTAAHLAASLLLATAVLGLLLPFAGADPPAGLTGSNAPFTDEGFNLANARNRVLFGRFGIDELDRSLSNGAYSAVGAAVFLVTRPRLAAGRAVSMVCLAAAVLLLALGLAEPLGRPAALLAAAALGGADLALEHGRLALVEPMVVMLLTAAFVLAVRSRQRPSLPAGAATGLLVAAAVSVKATALLPGLVLLGVPLASALRARARVSRAPAERGSGADPSGGAASPDSGGAPPGAGVARAAGGGVARAAGAGVARAAGGTGRVAAALAAVAAAGGSGLVWLLVVALPNAGRLRTALRVWPRVGYPGSPGAVAARLGEYLANSDQALGRSAPLLAGAGTGLVVAAARWRALDPARREALVMAAGWGVGLWAAVAVGDYAPNRYVVPALPGLAVLAGFGLATLAGGVPRRGLAGGVPGRGLASGVRRRGLAGGVVVVVLGVAVAGPGVARFLAGSDPGADQRARDQQMLAALLPAGATVYGAYAPTLLFDTRLRLVTPWPPAGANVRDPVGRLGVTHVLSGGPGDPTREVPALRGGARLVPLTQVPWAGQMVWLYEVRPESTGTTG